MDKQQLMEEYERFILLPDRQAFELLLCGVASHFMDRAVPFWVLYVGASGSGKSTALEIFGGHEKTNILDDWTARTMLNGLEGNENYIDIHDDEVWIVSDLSEAISNPTEKGKIMSQLRRVYDGSLNKAFGSEQTEVHWDGKITFVVGVTDAIDREETFMEDNALGERFSRVNVRGEEIRKEAAERAFDSRQSGKHNRADLREYAHDFINEVRHRTKNGVDIATPSWVRTRLIDLGDRASLLRTPIIGRKGGGIEDLPSPEFGTRLSMQLGVMSDTHAMLEGRSELNPTDVALAQRLALDAIPRVRSRILSALLNGAKNQAQVERFTHMPYSTVGRHIDRLFALEIIDKFNLKLYPDWEKALDDIGLANELMTHFPARIDNWQIKEVTE